MAIFTGRVRLCLGADTLLARMLEELDTSAPLHGLQRAVKEETSVTGALVGLHSGIAIVVGRYVVARDG